MHDSDISQKLLHHSISMVGGFMGAYTVVNFCEIFANAQTGNLIHLVQNIFLNNYTLVFFLIASFFVYMLGNISFVFAEKYFKNILQPISLFITSLTVVIIGIFINYTNSFFLLLPVCFTMPFQWNTFRKSGDYVCSTIFSTNNVREATVSITQYFLTKDKAKLSKGLFYVFTLICFYSGVTISCLTSYIFSYKSIWFAFLPISFAVITYIICLLKDKSIEKQDKN